jgi:hypothetical protein
MESRHRRGVKRVTVRITFANGHLAFMPIDIPAAERVDNIRTLAVDNVRFTRVREYQERPEILD